MLRNGGNTALQADLVEDLGAVVEQEIPEIARQLVDAEPDAKSIQDFAAVLAHRTIHTPSFSLPGSAREACAASLPAGSACVDPRATGATQACAPRSVAFVTLH
ncbi:hypothetical protein [Rhodopila sp.]|uniref:hypothetical protein n=1 Tax=Rhodopila sp. TaxID=2480087 RepID=UPI003D0E0B29